jgi:hypothetical protein
MDELEQYIKEQYQLFWQSMLHRYFSLIGNNSDASSVEEITEEEVKEFECSFNKWLMGDNNQGHANYLFIFSEYLYKKIYGVSKGVECTLTLRIGILKTILLYYQEVILFLDLAKINGAYTERSPLIEQSNERCTAIVKSLNDLGVQETELKILVTLSKIAFVKNKMSKGRIEGSCTITNHPLLENFIINNLRFLLTLKDLDLTTEIGLLARAIDLFISYKKWVLSLFNKVIDLYIKSLIGLNPSLIVILEQSVKLILDNYLNELTDRYKRCLSPVQASTSNNSNGFFTALKDEDSSEATLNQII